MGNVEACYLYRKPGRGNGDEKNGQEKIRDFDLCRLVSSCARVVKEEQQCMIPASLVRRLVRCSQQRIHFRFLEICNRRPRRPLRWNGAELSAPLDVFGALHADKTSQGVDRSQPLVPGGHGAFTGFL